MSENATRNRFLDELRRVLRNLYDPTVLAQSPLTRVFDVQAHGNPAQALRQVVIGGIQALKPDHSVPPTAPAWRIYQVLAQCYIEQSCQTIVANNLGLSVRQLRRQQREAEHALADYLWAHHRLEARADRLMSDAALQAPIPPEAAAVGANGRQEELDWLSQSLATGSVDVAEVLRAAVNLTAPLAQRHNVRLEYDSTAAGAPIVGQASLLRQALINLMVGAISAVPGGQVHAETATDAQEIVVRVEAIPAGPGAFVGEDTWTESLAMAQQLIGRFGGRLELSPAGASERSRTVTLRLTPPERLPVLVIDDNQDTLHLFERYLSGTRYQFIGARDPEQALALAAQAHPRVVLLDIMLPNVDGWELLGRLREHPQTGGIPIIVCTILPQEPLALALGAAAFLRKPVSREALLALLDRQIASSVPG